MTRNPGVPNGNGAGRHDDALPIARDDPERKLLDDVKEYGWHVVAVGGDEEGPPFGYTIGLYHTFGHPEVIIFGLDVRMMFEIVTNIGFLIKSGETFDHLDESSEILEGYLVTFRDVERRHYPDYFGFARWFYQGDQFPAIQCIWPDAQHHYPWHPDFAEGLAPAQPVLSDDRSWPFQEGRNRAVFTTKPVIHEGRPILLASHDEEGDWQFLCGTTDRTEDGLVVCLGDLFDRDPTTGELADLPEGWRATRPDDHAPWMREPISTGDEE